MTSTDRNFAGSIPRIYDTLLVPLIFEPYAVDIANRLIGRPPRRLLEIAAGTGVVTRKLAAVLPDSVMVATDLNPAMIDQAKSAGMPPRVTWRQADAQQLPFGDAEFDAVVCQFGVMFFPDKVRAFAEARRVLAPDGLFLFNVWDQIETSEFAATVSAALAMRFPADPPQFLVRTPHGYFDRRAIERDLAAGGFGASPRIDTVTECSRAATARTPAVAYCQGTPLRNEIEARDPAGLEAATAAAADALAGRFGAGIVAGKIQALVVSVEN